MAEEIVSRKDWLKEEINEKRLALKRLINVKISSKPETGDDFLMLQEEMDRLENEIAEMESELKIEQEKENVQLPPFVVNDINPVMSFAENIDWSISILDIPRIHKEFGLTGKGVKVAVLDTACDVEHEDLKGAVIEAYNTTNEPYPTNKSAFNGHSIAVSSLIGARRNNLGILSVAPDCEIIAIKCLMESGSGTMIDITEAINLAVDRGAHIINLSLGGASSTPALQAAVKRAASRGVYVICAAGNSGGNNTVGYPGKYEEAYAVAAINSQKRVSAFSSRGLEVDIAAPGERVLTCFKNNGYATISGTSFASPIVSGCFALFKQGGIKADWQMLKDTAIDIEEPGHDVKAGHGLINPYEIVKRYYKKQEVCVDPVVSVVDITESSAKLQWPAAADHMYTVLVHRKDGTISDYRTSNNWFTINDLLPNTKYLAQVRANCNNGVSLTTEVNFITKTSSSPNVPISSTSASPSVSPSASPSAAPEPDLPGKPIDKIVEAERLTREANRLITQWLQS